MEKLTTHQIVLLTLLVSFVTSIATGIVTVTLVDQAPPAVTNTVNRVVERTVERVVEDDSQQAASVITKETTVVVKEEDLITEAIADGSQSLVRIETTSLSEDQKTLYKTVGLATLISESGMAVADSGVIAPETEFIARIGGERFPFKVLYIDDDAHLALLQIMMTQEDERTFKPVSFVDQKDLKLGQTVITIGGAGRNTVHMGVISALVDDIRVVDEEETKVLAQISTTVTGNKLTGNPNFNVFGEMIGVGVSSDTESFVVPAGKIVSTLQAYKDGLSDEEPEEN